MEVSLFKLSSVGVMQIEQIVEFGNIEDKQIKGLKDVFVKGIIKYNVLEEIELNLDVKGTMIINDSITLEEIPYDFSFNIEETIDKNNPEYSSYFKNNQNILDISEILWENIVLEVPMSYSNEHDVNLSGKGWEFNNSDK